MFLYTNFFIFCNELNNNNIVYAMGNNNNNNKAIKHTNTFNSEKEKIVQDLVKKTSLKANDLYIYLDKGLNKEDIQNCYIVFILSEEKMDNIVNDYIDENNLSLLLKDYNIERNDFEKKYNQIFSEEKSSIERDNIPWRKATQK